MFSPGTLDPDEELEEELLEDELDELDDELDDDEVLNHHEDPDELDDELDDDELLNHHEDPDELDELELELELELDEDEINHHCALQVEAVNPARNKLTTPIIKNFPTNFLSIEKPSRKGLLRIADYSYRLCISPLSASRIFGPCPLLFVKDSSSNVFSKKPG